MRVLYRICHFILYAFLFLTKQAKHHLHYYLNTLRWVILMISFKLNDEAIMATCVTGNRLGAKKLAHTAIIVNNLDDVENNPPVAQMTKLAEVVTWLLISQSDVKQDKSVEGSKENTRNKLITLYDKTGQIDQFSDLLYAMLKIRLASEPEYSCSMMQNKESNQVVISRKGELASIELRFIQAETIPEKRKDLTEQLPQLALVFNSNRRVLKCDGFHSYLKEIAEIVECGELTQFRKIEYIQTMTRFGNTQQRWGI